MTISKKTKLDKMIDAHWKFIAKLLHAHCGLEEEDREFVIIKHHYTTAFEHGYKHGKEDSK